MAKYLHNKSLSFVIDFGLLIHKIIKKSKKKEGGDLMSHGTGRKQTVTRAKKPSYHLPPVLFGDSSFYRQENVDCCAKFNLSCSRYTVYRFKAI